MQNFFTNFFCSGCKIFLFKISQFLSLKFLFQTFFVKKFSLFKISLNFFSKSENDKKITKNKKNGRDIDRREPLPTVNRKLARPVKVRSVIYGSTTCQCHATTRNVDADVDMWTARHAGSRLTAASRDALSTRRDGRRSGRRSAQGRARRLSLARRRGPRRSLALPAGRFSEVHRSPQCDIPAYLYLLWTAWQWELFSFSSWHVTWSLHLQYMPIQDYSIYSQ